MDMKRIGVSMLKALTSAYIFTFVFILIVAMVLFYTGVSEKVISVCVYANYFISNFIGGRIIGRRSDKRRFLWGMACGLLYAVIIVIVSSIGGNAGDIRMEAVIMMMIFTIIGGMFGGMLC